MTQELVSLTIIMAVAAVSPIVAQLIPGRFIPQTVLLLAAGTALGPYGLGVIEVNDAVKLLSELGMAFLFLLAGYEIDPKRLAGHQGKVGLVTWIITLGLAGLVVTLLPFFAKQGINGVATVIALTTTALGTLMPILKERNLEGTPIGDAIISYGTWGELGPILAMAILLSTRTGWQTMLVLGAFLMSVAGKEFKARPSPVPFPYGQCEHVIANAHATDHIPAHLPCHHFRAVRT